MGAILYGYNETRREVGVIVLLEEPELDRNYE